MRHKNGAHPGVKLIDCFPEPFMCLYQQPRPRDAHNLPFGPAMPRCLATFATKSMLDTHRALHKEPDEVVRAPSIASSNQGNGPAVTNPVRRVALDVRPLPVRSAEEVREETNDNSRPSTSEKDPMPRAEKDTILANSRKHLKRKADDESEYKGVTPSQKRSRRTEEPKIAFLRHVDSLADSMDDTSLRSVDKAMSGLIALLRGQSFIRSESFSDKIALAWRSGPKSKAAAEECFNQVREFAGQVV